VPHLIHAASIASILVVMLHAGGRPGREVTNATLLAAIDFVNGALGLVRMPLFFFIAGFAFMHSNPPGRSLAYGDFVRKKALRLLIPYAVLTTLAFPVKAMFGDAALRPLELTLGSYLRALVDARYTPIIFYWFILALFVVFLVAPVLRTVLSRGSAASLAALSLVLLAIRWYAMGAFAPWCPAPQLPTAMAVDQAVANLFYLWAGMLGWRFRSAWLDHPRALLAVLGVAGLAIYHASGVGHLVLRFPFVLFGIYAVFWLVDLYVRAGWRFLQPVDGRTYQVYLLAWFPQQFAVIVLYTMLGWNYWLCATLTLVGGLVVPLIVAGLVARHAPPFVGALIGLPLRPRTRAVDESADPERVTLAACHATGPMSPAATAGRQDN
jgi:hypothetical protein